jgi:hypothetical protein
MENYLELADAATYVGVTVSYLKDRCRAGQTGPKFFRPSPKKTLFLRGDLDAWVKSWRSSETK